MQLDILVQDSNEMYIPVKPSVNVFSNSVSASLKFLLAVLKFSPTTISLFNTKFPPSSSSLVSSTSESVSNETKHLFKVDCSCLTSV